MPNSYVSNVALLKDKLDNPQQPLVTSDTTSQTFIDWNKDHPLETGLPITLYDYELELSEKLDKHKHLWIKKATGLGITEYFLRQIAWRCETDPTWKDGEVLIITGPNLDLSIGLIDRIKGFYSTDFTSKNTVVEINGCRVKAYPSHHLDAARSLTNVKFILLDEADFFPPGEQLNARAISERYIAKGNPYIIMVSTPHLPGGLFETIEKQEPCLYERITMLYDRGMPKDGKPNIYTLEEIQTAKESPMFEGEYNGKYGQGLGNIYPYQFVDEVTKSYDQTLKQGYKVLAVDPAYGSSKFAIVAAEKLDGIIYIKEALQFERPLPSAMTDLLVIKAKDYPTTLVDAAHPGLIADLRARGVNVIEVAFNKELSAMTIESAQAVKELRVRIHPAYSDLLAQLKTVRYNDKGHPDKTELTFDLGDAFMMSVNYLKSSEIGGRLMRPSSNIPPNPTTPNKSSQSSITFVTR